MNVLRTAGLLLLAGLPACSLFGDEDPGVWTERSLNSSPPRRELLSYCHRGMVQAGYPLPEIDEAHDRVVSGWRTELQPFGGAGLRRRATLEVVPGASGAVTLRARVEAQSNEELARPMDPAEAKWKDQPDDEVGARILLQHVVTLMETSGAGGARR